MTDPKPMDDLLTIELRLVERVWGRRDLRPWYSTATTAPIGEAWLTSGDCTVSSGEHAGETLEALVARHPKELGNGVGAFPLLVKLLFPDEKLSVQVHPDDAQALLMGGAALPKTECWYVLQGGGRCCRPSRLCSGNHGGAGSRGVGNAAVRDAHAIGAGEDG